MKNILKFLVAMIVITVISLSAATCIGQTIDSTAILHPETRELLVTVDDEIKFYRALDSLNSIYRTDAFITVHYMSDGSVDPRRVSKDKPKQGNGIRH